VCRSFPSRLAPSTPSWLSRVDPIQRSLEIIEDAVKQQRSILLVEPDAPLREAWRIGLAGMGFHVRESTDSEGALRAAMRSEINLLITELYLPTGAEPCLVRATRRQRGLRRMKILVVSERSTADDRAWALTEGADAYLVKPVRLGRLLQVAGRLAMSSERRSTEILASGARERVE
jgi:DNA-binding response OmpR family regulator